MYCLWPQDQRSFAPSGGWTRERYKKTYVYNPAEYYVPEDEHAGYEDDNNEY